MATQVHTKARNMKVTYPYLDQRAAILKDSGYPVSKWITFCETLLDNGFQVYLYEAKETKSKYVTVKKHYKEYRVRFSDHKPNKIRELQGDCDFFVGITHTGVRTTADALVAVSK